MLKRICNNGKWGMCDGKEQMIIPCRWDNIKEFSEGLIPVKSDGKWGYVNLEAELVMPCQWEDAGHFVNGFAPVKANGKWGFINRMGEQVVSCTWDRVTPFYGKREGKQYARVMEGNRMGMVDQNGRLLLPCAWSVIGWHGDIGCWAVLDGSVWHRVDPETGEIGEAVEEYDDWNGKSVISPIPFPIEEAEYETGYFRYYEWFDLPD